jgi:hypothetical protein
MGIVRIALIGAGLAAGLGAQTADGERFFETAIRPLLVEKCQMCHGSKQPMAGLDLTTGAWLHSEAAAALVVPGSPETSRLMEVLGYQGKIKMPPTGRLKDQEIAALAEWIRIGAPWPGAGAGASQAKKPGLSDKALWSVQPVKEVVPPEVRHRGWIANEVDRFILARLEQAGLEAAPPADKMTLLRRATFDLTGLPPSEAEMRDFLADDSPNAFARVVDRLLASPRYGERWGRHWLDVARYADSTGADEDHRYPHAWRYRDYVIDAFNADLPYDRFVMEQIAGDLLPAGEPGAVNVRGIVATGFLALGPKLIAEQDKVKMLYDIIDEQIDVTGRALLGLTLACARCHDHKFDPISTRDYYSLASIFASTRQLSKIEGTVSQLYFAPLVPRDVSETYEAHQKKIEAKKQEIADLASEETKRYAASLRPRLADYMLTAWKVVQTGADSAGAASEAGLDAGNLDRWVEYLKPTQERRPHLEQLYHAAPAALPAVTREYQARFEATYNLREQSLAEWRKAAEQARASGQTTPEQPRFLPGDDRFYHEVYVAAGPLNIPEKEREKLFSDTGKARLFELTGQLKALEESSPPELPLACAVAEGDPVTQRVFIRGNWENPGDEVTKAIPAVLAGDEQPEFGSGSGRLELARWLADPANPLTARVMVNRIWQWHFGEGLVRTPSNFGVMGEPPTHPELLDYLARRFVDGGWSIKAMHRLVMLSNTYRLSSQISPEQWEKDPGNNLWSHFQRRRLDVEEIRDAMLYLDGTLDLTAGGSLQEGQGTDQEFSDARKSINPLESKRRLVYLPLRRSNLPTLLNLFDFGDATTTSEGRSRTNIAPQALFMMNSKFVAERAETLAKALLEASESDDSRVERAYRLILARTPRPEETAAAQAYLRRYPPGQSGTENGLAGWRSLCRILLASNDFIYVN